MYVHILQIYEFVLLSILISNGLVDFHDMAFGWILGTPKVERLTATYGLCSERESSFQFKADGMLSASLFCAILRKFYDNKIIRAHFVSDNNKMIDQCTERQLYVNPWPNTTLEGDWDVTKEVYQTHKNDNIEAIFGKVKCHCNRNKRYDDLPLETQCNVDTSW